MENCPAVLFKEYKQIVMARVRKLVNFFIRCLALHFALIVFTLIVNMFVVKGDNIEGLFAVAFVFAPLANFIILLIILFNYLDILYHKNWSSEKWASYEERQVLREKQNEIMKKKCEESATRTKTLAKEFAFWRNKGRLIKCKNTYVISYFSKEIGCGDNVLVGDVPFQVSAVGETIVELRTVIKGKVHLQSFGAIAGRGFFLPILNFGKEDDAEIVLNIATKDNGWWLIRSFNGETLFSSVPATQVCVCDSCKARELYSLEERKMNGNGR